RARFRQLLREREIFRAAELAELLRDVVAQLVGELGRAVGVRLERHERADRLARDIVVLAGDGGARGGQMGELRPVRVFIPLVVTVDAAQHRRPRTREHDVTAAAERYRFALVVDEIGYDPGERFRGRAGFR